MRAPDLKPPPAGAAGLPLRRVPLYASAFSRMLSAAHSTAEKASATDPKVAELRATTAIVEDIAALIVRLVHTLL